MNERSAAPVSNASLSATIQRMLASASLRDGTDDDLLNRFIQQNDEAAFHAIVRRHGSMVWTVCRSVLRNEADAEDAFQATFLLLAVKARAVLNPRALAGLAS